MNSSIRRMFAAVLALLLVTGAALAAGIKLQINSSQKIETQIEAFKKYLTSLPADQRDLWMKQIEAMAFFGLESQIDKSSDSLPQPAADTQMVWIPRSGSKYHKKATCSNMKNPRRSPRKTPSPWAMKAAASASPESRSLVFFRNLRTK